MKQPFAYRGIAVSAFALFVFLPVLYMVFSPVSDDPAGLVDRLSGLFSIRQMALAKNSLLLALGASLAGLVMGVPYAYFCARTRLKAKSFFTWAGIIPILIPPYIHAVVWMDLAEPLKNMFSLDVFTLGGAIFVLTCAYFPFVVVMTRAGLAGIDRNLEEASLIHHGPLPTLFRVTLPLALPHILSGAIFVFVFSMVNVSIPDLLRVRVYPLEIFIQFSAFYDQSAAILLSVPLVFLTFLLLVFQQSVMAGRSYVQVSQGRTTPIIHSPGYAHIPVFVFCMGVVAVTMILPMIILAGAAGPLTTYIDAVRTSYRQIGYSLGMAFAGSVTTLAIGFILAYYIERSRGAVNRFVAWTVSLPFAIPATSIGICLIGLWNRPYLDTVYDSSVIVILGYIARFLPFAVLILLSGIRQISCRFEEAAHLTDASFYTILWRIILPLSGPSLAAVLFIVFILSFGELGASLLIIPPGRETIPIKIYNLMHYGADQAVAALCLIIIAVILGIASLFALYRTKTPAFAR